MKILKNKKGNGILTFIIIIAVTAILAVTVLPPLNDAIENRIESTVDNFNGTDTITELD